MAADGTQVSSKSSANALDPPEGEAPGAAAAALRRRRPSGATSTSGDPDESVAAKRKFPKHLVEIYDIDCMLGQGAFSTVWRCTHRQSGQVRALKKIDTLELSPREIAHEIALMKLLRHPNVVRCYDVFLEAHFVNIVVDMFTGGDLVDGLNAHRQDRGRIPDAQLANLTRQMVAAVIHVHSLCIIHRDIKGENFLTDRPDIGDPECVVALADFGTAARLEPGATLSDKVGTPAFWAPEVCMGQYDFLADVWAVGVTVFILLCGALPFEGEAAICQPVASGALSFSAPYFATSACVDFLAACLAKDPGSRPQASEVARLPWMETPVPSSAPRPAISAHSFAEALGSAAETIGSILGGLCACFTGLCLELLAASEPAPKSPSSTKQAADEAVASDD